MIGWPECSKYAAPMALKQNSRPGCPERLGYFTGQFVLLPHGTEELFKAWD
jgi:hypothetical protein